MRWVLLVLMFSWQSAPAQDVDFELATELVQRFNDESLFNQRPSRPGVYYFQSYPGCQTVQSFKTVMDEALRQVNQDLIARCFEEAWEKALEEVPIEDHEKEKRKDRRVAVRETRTLVCGETEHQIPVHYDLVLTNERIEIKLNYTLDHSKTGETRKRLIRRYEDCHGDFHDFMKTQKVVYHLQIQHRYKGGAPVAMRGGGSVAMGPTALPNVAPNSNQDLFCRAFTQEISKLLGLQPERQGFMGKDCESLKLRKRRWPYSPFFVVNTESEARSLGPANSYIFPWHLKTIYRPICPETAREPEADSLAGG